MDKAFALIRLASLALAGAALVLLLRVPEPPPEEAVRQAFAAYKRAVLANDGSAAAALMSDETIAWYGRMQDLALHGSKEEVEGLGPLEKVQVLAFRQRIPAGELRAMSARQLVAYAVAHGWVGRAGTERSELGTVTTADRTVVAQLLLHGRDSGQQYHFVREGGRWLFNQLPTLNAGAEGIKTVAAQRGMTTDQFVQFMVESGSGKKITEDTWMPPFPRTTPGAAR